MTRAIVYSAGLAAFVAGTPSSPFPIDHVLLTETPATAMTLTAIALPNWISFHSPLNPSDDLTLTYGLHRLCSSLDTPSCRHFPDEAKDCQGTHGYFCGLWRTTGFLMNFAAVLELATIVAYVVILAGGKQKRQNGWKLLGVLLVVTGAVQCAAMAIVVSFLPGSVDMRLLGY
jgi:hypothetical protein